MAAAGVHMRGEIMAAYTAMRTSVGDYLRNDSPFSQRSIDEALTSLFDEHAPSYLGLPHQYFDSHSPEQVAKHVATLVAARELARSGGRAVDMHIQQEGADQAFFAARSLISMDRRSGRVMRRSEGGSIVSPASRLERFIESKYLSQGENTAPSADFSSFSNFSAAALQKQESVNVAPGAAGPAAPAASAALPWRLQCYRSRGVLDDGSHLRMYFLQQADFVNPAPAAGETSIDALGDRRFLAATPPALKAIYQKVVADASTRMGPAIHVELSREVSGGEDADAAGPREGQSVETVNLFIAHRAGSTHSYFSSTPDVYRAYSLFAVAKTTEVFSNGIIVFYFRLRQLDPSRANADGIFTPAPHSFGGRGPSESGDGFSLDGPAGRGSPLMKAGAGRGSAGHLPSIASAGNLAPGSGSAAGASAMARNPSATAFTFDRETAAMEALRDRRSVYAAGGPNAPSLGERMRDLVRDVALHFVLPRTSLTPLLSQGLLSAQEIAYAYCAWKFTFTFVSRMTAEFNGLNKILRSPALAGDSSSEAMSLLSKLRKQVQSHSYTETQILDCIYRYPDVVAVLYDQFAARFKPFDGGAAAAPLATPKGIAGRAAPTAKPMSHDAMMAYLRKTVKTSEDDLAIFEGMLQFNESVLRTNFFRRDIVALSFRLETSFLAKLYTEVPYGVYMVIGAEFRAFQVRFADVARGGIRLIKSASAAVYNSNLNGLFEECYALAQTQNRKNKDIPEAGSKATILLSLGHQDKATVAFKKFIDGLLDLMLAHARSDVVDYMDGKHEILFCGPDENTADLMDWACEHARNRGYSHWKSFTTGKAPRLGGVPHDVYGMTTRGVRTYVEGLQRKLGLAAKAAQLTKLQTGGPDGDLGSNEIILANERTVGVVDGSGVAFDPDGLHREELLRLAHGRRMVKEFNRSLLGGRGFVVTVDQSDVKLPDGTVVPSGVQFRNNFHCNAMAAADEFVPCGGRPAAVNIDNVEAFLYGSDPAGSAAPVPGREGVKRAPRFTFIVEGANLFITQDARLWLERKGVVVIKDASANKGGVGSSSCEVLAALTLNDAEFREHMCVHADTGATPPFYAAYVKDIQAFISSAAAAEFECLWRERERTGEALSLLSDRVSTKIVTLSTAIEGSDSLWGNAALRRAVLAEAVPPTLQALVGGIDVVMTRLPENYQRALFGARLASRFVYATGLDAPDFAFYEYAARLGAAATANGAAH